MHVNTGLLQLPGYSANDWIDDSVNQLCASLDTLGLGSLYAVIQSCMFSRQLFCLDELLKSSAHFQKLIHLLKFCAKMVK